MFICQCHCVSSKSILVLVVSKLFIYSYAVLPVKLTFHLMFCFIKNLIDNFFVFAEVLKLSSPTQLSGSVYVCSLLKMGRRSLLLYQMMAV